MNEDLLDFLTAPRDANGVLSSRSTTLTFYRCGECNALMLRPKLLCHACLSNYVLESYTPANKENA